MVELAVTSVIQNNIEPVIFSAKNQHGKLIRVVAHDICCDPHVGETYEIDGEMGVYQDPYGREVLQITTSYIQRTQTSGLLIFPWLRSLPGIGKTRAQNLWDACGSGIIDLLKDSNCVDQIARIIEPKRQNIGYELAMQLNRATNFKVQDDRFGIAEAKFRLRLEEFGITDRRAVKRIWRMIGDEKAENKFFQNPYMTATLISWKSSDQIGQRIIKIRDKADPTEKKERLVAAVDSCWRHFLQNGHTAATETQLLNALLNRLKSPKLAKKALSVGLQYEAAVKEESGVLRAPGAAFMEDEIASRISVMANSTVDNINEFGLNRFIRNIEADIGVHLFDEQRDAIIQLLKRNFGILQGPAGTGKTYLMKVLVKLWEALGGHCILGGSVELACLAGKAAMQLRRSANRPAYTLAGLLRYLHRRRKRLDEGRDVPNHWPSLESSTLLIVDEASMVDVGTWHDLFDFMPPGCRLLMVGDNGQLPPVGIGQIYHDLVKRYPYVVKLTLNHRQKSKTGIPEIANAIREGRMPSFKNYRGAEQGVQFYECPEDSIIKNVAKIKNEILSQINEGEVLICAALRKTVDILNESGAMQNHKLKIPLRAAPGVWIADGDPVVYTENRKKSELYNGLLGRVVQVSNSEEKSALIHWDGEDEPRKICGRELSGIDLAYAITVHKVQGSSAPRIIVPLERNRLVTRQWLYTAVTRAEEQCLFVGNKSLFSASLKRLTKRNTGFRLKDI